MRFPEQTSCAKPPWGEGGRRPWEAIKQSQSYLLLTVMNHDAAASLAVDAQYRCIVTIFGLTHLVVVNHSAIAHIPDFDPECIGLCDTKIVAVDCCQDEAIVPGAVNSA